MATHSTYARTFSNKETSGLFTSETHKFGQFNSRLQGSRGPGGSDTRSIHSHRQEEFESHAYTPNRLTLSSSNLPTLIQIVRNHRVNPLNQSFIPQIAVISNGSRSFDSSKGSLQSYLESAGIDLRHSLPISVDSSIENDDQFMDALIRSLIEVYPNLLIQFDYSYDHPFNGLFFTTNADAAKQLIEFYKFECKMSEKKANGSVFLVDKKDIVSRDFDNQFKKQNVYFSYGESEYQSKSIKDALDYVNSLEYVQETLDTESIYSNYSAVWTVADIKNFKSNLSITTYVKDGKELEIIHSITVQVSVEEREMVLGHLQSYVVASDAVDICSSQAQDINGSFTIHNLILDHLKIQSSDEAIKGLTFYVGLESLKRCDISIWQTAFVMVYLERVLAEHQSEWETAYKKADHWISGQLEESHYKALYFACGEYLIQKGIEVYNELNNKFIVNFDVDDDTKVTIGKMLKSTAKEADAIDLCNAQSRDGSFKCHELIAGRESIAESFKIKLSEDNINSLKNFVDKLCLRRFDKDVWVNSLIIVYFDMVLAKYKSNWNSACNNAKMWVSQRVRNREYEKELYDACSKYLLKQGYDYLLNKYHLLN